MNKTAKRFLDCYARNLEVEGGLMYAKALQQARLDYSPGSLERIEALLTQLREKVRPTQDAFLSSQPNVNFCYMLAFYLGSYVSKEAGAHLDWYEYGDASQVLPADYGLPEAFFSRLFAVVGGIVFLPLGWISDKLFTPDGGPTCADYVSSFLHKISARRRMSENDWCRDYLARFFEDRAIPGGLAFRVKLRTARLDYSLASLGRIDALLTELRRSERLDYGTFVSEQETANFLLLLAYYIGSTLARAGRISLEWQGFDEIKEALPDLERDFETTVGCILAGRFYFPLGVLSEVLFAPQPERTVQGYGADILAASPPNFTPIPRLAGDPSPPAGTVPAIWSQAMGAMGFLAAYGMFMVAEGATMIPTLLKPGQDGKTTLVKLVVPEPEDVSELGAKDLAENPDGLSYQAFVFEAKVRLPTGPGDALIIELRCYGESPLSVKACFPFLPADHPRGFAVLEPLLIESSLAPDGFATLQGSLYDGIDGFKADGFSWPRPQQAADTAAPSHSAEAEAEAEAEAVAMMRQAAEGGSANAQYQLAMCYEAGQGVAQDYGRCVHWYEMAAAQGHGAAINNLGDKYEHGLGVEQDLAKALALYLQAADKNILAAWYSLGMMYHDGRGVPRDLQQAIDWMEKAAHYDFPDAKDSLAAMQREASLRKKEEAATVLTNTPDEMEAPALYEMGLNVYDPDVPETIPFAFDLLLRAANKGHPGAQHQVGFFYHRGLGVEADAAQALDWYRKSADQGDMYSLERLGELHEAGELVPKNLPRAFKYYLQAAKAGALLAGYRVACMYQEGLGTPVDVTEAIRWMKKSLSYSDDAPGRLEALERLARRKFPGSLLYSIQDYFGAIPKTICVDLPNPISWPSRCTHCAKSMNGIIEMVDRHDEELHYPLCAACAKKFANYPALEKRWRYLALSLLLPGLIVYASTGGPVLSAGLKFLHAASVIAIALGCLALPAYLLFSSRMNVPVRRISARQGYIELLFSNEDYSREFLDRNKPRARPVSRIKALIGLRS